MEKKYKRWSKEETADDKTKRIEIEEVENGYVISKSISYNDPESGYDYKCKKYISETNPLTKESKGETEAEDFLGKYINSVNIG